MAVPLKACTAMAAEITGVTHKTKQRAFPQLVPSDSSSKPVFWHLLPAPVIGCHQRRLLSLRTKEWMDKKIFCDAKTEMVQPHGAELNEDEKSAKENDFETSPGLPCQGDEFDLANLVQTKAQLSYAMTVVNKISGSHVEGRREDDARQRDRGRKTGGVHVDLIKKNSYLQRREKHRSLQGIDKRIQSRKLSVGFAHVCCVSKKFLEN